MNPFRGWVRLLALLCALKCAVDVYAERWANNRTLVPDPAANYRALAPDGPPLLWLYEVPAGLATIDLFREIANPDLGSGRRTRTADLRVMGPTSWPLLYPASDFVSHRPGAVKSLTALGYFRTGQTGERRFTQRTT